MASRFVSYSLLAASMSLVGIYVALSKPLTAAIPVFVLAFLRFAIAAVAMAPFTGARARRAAAVAHRARADVPAVVLRQLPVLDLHAHGHLAHERDRRGCCPRVASCGRRAAVVGVPARAAVLARARGDRAGLPGHRAAAHRARRQRGHGQPCAARQPADLRLGAVRGDLRDHRQAPDRDAHGAACLGDHQLVGPDADHAVRAVADGFVPPRRAVGRDVGLAGVLFDHRQPDRGVALAHGTQARAGEPRRRVHGRAAAGGDRRRRALPRRAPRGDARRGARLRDRRRAAGDARAGAGARHTSRRERLRKPVSSSDRARRAGRRRAG